MLFSLACLIGLTLAGHDGSTVPAGSARAACERAAEPTVPVTTTADAPDEGCPDPAATPLDDEVEGFPDEPEGEDPEDPGEAMGPRGHTQSSACVATPR
uniref:hypothetical protein n=1 Tax=Paludisphaera sp. TaxID=2017432 RepID=UPI00301BC379